MVLRFSYFLALLGIVWVLMSFVKNDGLFSPLPEPSRGLRIRFRILSVLFGLVILILAAGFFFSGQ